MPNRNIESEIGNINRRLPFVAFIRRPTATDIRNPQTGRIYERPYFWRVKNNADGTAPDSGTQGELWYLEDITANIADWKMLIFAAGATGIISITGDLGGAVTGDGGGDMDLNGLVVASGTRAKPVFFNGTSGSFIQELEVQVSTERTGAPLNNLDVGLCSFDDTAFVVDSLGYVTLVGGGVTPPTMLYNIDTNTAPGTDPTVPTALGIIGIKGAVVAAHSVPIETHARAINEFNIEVQVGAAVTGAPSSKQSAGLVQFDDTSFAVDSDGFVTFIGGAGNPVVTITGDDAVATSPDGAGDMGLTGLTVANATNTKPVYVNGGTNTEVVEVQVATEITGAPADSNDAGIASYNDTQFTVDTNGYVELVGGADLSSVQTLTGDDAAITGPDASGNLDITGLAVANATNAKPIYFNGGTNTEVCEVQVSTEITGAPGDKNDAGICSFDDTDFAVDSDGFVTFIGAGGGGDVPSSNQLIEFEDFDRAFTAGTDIIFNSNRLQAGGTNANWLADVQGLSYDDSRPGIVAGQTGTTTTGYALVRNNMSTVFGIGAYEFECSFKPQTLSDGTNRFSLFAGFGNFLTNAAEPTDGAYFMYSDTLNSGDWVGKTASSSTRTSANSTNTVSTGWVKLKITVNAGGTSVAFFVNDVEIAGSPLTTNISTAELSAGIKIGKSVGTSTRQQWVDYIKTKLVLTTNR